MAARLVDGSLTGVPVEEAIDLKRIEAAVREILIALGEDPERDGLLKTPARVARAYAELFAGLRVDPSNILKTTFEADHDELILVKDIPMFSLCLPSEQLVNAVSGAKRVRDLEYGEQLWTLVDGEVKRTSVVDMVSHKVRDLVEVRTEKGVVQATPDHPFATPDGWVEAKDLDGKWVEWTLPKGLSRRRYEPEAGYDFGYAVGACCADGTVAPRYMSLVVNERYVGGDAHHMRQKLPRVALKDIATFEGFLDGYIDGDGHLAKYSGGRLITSGNVAFLQEIAQVIGARFTPNPKQPASALYVRDSWYAKHGFVQEDHRTTLQESQWVKVDSVRPLRAVGKKPYTVYSVTCEPYPTFLVNGHLTHNCEHHLLPFKGVAHVGYLPGTDGRITGLSKLVRLVEVYARRPQVQERLTSQIADLLEQQLSARGVIVVLECEHMCMEMRGIRKPGSRTVTSAVRGLHKTDPKTRAEALSLINAR
jgi:GTP cyclohydrolase I